MAAAMANHFLLLEEWLRIRLQTLRNSNQMTSRNSGTLSDIHEPS